MMQKNPILILDIDVNIIINSKSKNSKTKNVYTNFCGLNVPEHGVEYESFTIISIDSLVAYDNTFYLQVYLNNCDYKVVDKQMTDCIDDNLFEPDED